MPSNFFALMVLGHLVADFLLQPQWMATKKGSHPVTCFIHCGLVTWVMLMFTFFCFGHAWQLYAWGLFIYGSHYLIDWLGLADRWLYAMEGRSIKQFLAQGHRDIPYIEHQIDLLTSPATTEERIRGVSPEMQKKNYHILRGGFCATVYVVTDGTMHLTAMYLFALLLLY